MSLAAELSRFAEEFSRRCPPAWGPRLAAAMTELHGRDWAAGIPKVGELAPDVALEDLDGRPRAPLEAGRPVVLSFFRGGWCPYCTLELRAYEALRPEFEARGVELFAISGEAPARTREFRRTHDIRFPLLADVDQAVTRRYGLLFDVPADLHPIMEELGHAPEMVNAGGSARLSIPATFVIGPDRRILARHADMDYRRRMEPQDALAAALL